MLSSVCECMSRVCLYSITQGFPPNPVGDTFCLTKDFLAKRPTPPPEDQLATIY